MVILFPLYFQRLWRACAAPRLAFTLARLTASSTAGLRAVSITVVAPGAAVMELAGLWTPAEPEQS